MVAADLTTGGDDSVRATCDEARGDGGETVTSGGDAGDDDGNDDDGDGDGGEARGGDAAMEGGEERSGGSVATTGDGEASSGDGRPATKKQRRPKGRKTNGRRTTSSRTPRRGQVVTRPMRLRTGRIQLAEDHVVAVAFDWRVSLRPCL